MEAIYQQVEDAISRGLYVIQGRSPLGGPSYHRPRRIELGNIVLKSEGGSMSCEWTATTDEWAGIVERGLWRRVGMWNFAQADDPAADDIRHCHTSPASAGWLLHRLRQVEAAAQSVYDQLVTGESVPVDLARALGVALGVESPGEPS